MRLLFTFLLFTFYFTSTAQIPSYVPTNGLVGYWPFNGNANDESGNGNNGTVNGATLTSDRFGNVGKAYNFDGGLNTNIHVTLNQPIQGTKTFSVWVKLPVDFINPYSQLITADNTRFDYLSFLGNEPSYISSNIVGYFYDGKAYQMSLNRLNNMIWHNIVVIHNFQSLQSIVYVDGVLNSAGTSSNYQTNLSLSDFTFGSNYPGANIPGSNATVYGDLDDIAIYNRALTQTEITQLYTSTIIPTTPEDTTSNVGIGTTNPKRKLHINDVMRLEPRNTAPINPAKGDIYFDGVLNKLRVYDGTVWQNCW